jgi:Ca2+-binding RTX toxin-like protein
MMATINGNNSWDYILADYLDGTDSADIIKLFDGDDYAFGLLGNDSIFGGYGDDVLQGDGGADYLDGDYGADELSGNGGADILYGRQGNDELFGDADYYEDEAADDGADQLYGGQGADLLVGGAGGDKMEGGDGSDHIDSGIGTQMIGDSVNGGAGVDTLEVDYSLSGGAITFLPKDYSLTFAAPNGAGGTFTVVNVERFVVRGSNSADSLTGWELHDELHGGKGNDTLTGGDGNDELEGGAGSDFAYGGTGNDTIDGDEYNAVAGNDTIYGGFGSDYIDGGGAADKLYGENGHDNLDGDDGNDMLDGGQGGDGLDGGEGADFLYGGTGNDYLYSDWGGSHDDGLEVDSLSGGAGDDEIWVGVGDKANGGSNLVGSADRLRLTFDDLTLGQTHYATGVSYNLGSQGQVVTTLANGTQIVGFEELEFFGGAGNDTVAGGARADSLDGGLGNDVLAGGSGNDTLDGNEGADNASGGAGNDTFHDDDEWGQGQRDVYAGGDNDDTFYDGYGSDVLSGDGGTDLFYMSRFLKADEFKADSVNGGAGWDAVSYTDAKSSVYVDLLTQGTATQANAGAARGDTFAGIEELEGSEHDDVLLGDNLGNWLSGGGEDDRIEGRGGNDTIAGGTGADDLMGGLGADTFILEDDTYVAGSWTWEHDTIRDFVRGTDKLAVLESEFDVDQLTFKLLNQTTKAVTTIAGPTFVFETDVKRLWFDEDGKGLDTDGDGQIDTNVDAVLLATLNGITALAVSDFVFG